MILVSEKYKVHADMREGSIGEGRHGPCVQIVLPTV